MSILPVAAKGYFIDKRDNQLYHTIIMPDGKEWMIDNLNYKTGNCWAYNDDESNRQKYGLLYDWKTAMKACPSGWHLPTREEWNELVDGIVGKKLKSHKYGFSPLPGGSRRDCDGYFLSAGSFGYWWSATEHDGNYAYYQIMDYDYDYVVENSNYKDYGFSARYIKD